MAKTLPVSGNAAAVVADAPNSNDGANDDARTTTGDDETKSASDNTDKNKSESESQKSAEIKTVAMTRFEPMHPGGPTSADVHADEIDTWIAHGWRIPE